MASSLALASARSSREPTNAGWQTDPGLREIMMLALLASLVFVTTILCFANYRPTVKDFGDSQAYTDVATAIRHWDFRGLQIKQFWGYPYAIAAVSIATRLPEQASLLIVSCASYFLSILLAYKLWGGRIAALFTVLNFDWMQRSFLGGSEPLAVALIFGAFWSVRRERYLTAALLASLTTVVRPLGIFCLIGIGTVLFYRREYRKLTFATLIGTIVGGLYVVPFVSHFGDPLATVHSYQGAKVPLFGIPFYAIIKGTILYPTPWTNLALSFAWIALVLAGALAMLRNARFRDFARTYPVEILFAVPFLLMVFCYNYPVFARGSFARFVIPALPIVFLALSNWIPRDRRVIWALAAISPILAAASAIGIRNVEHLLRG